MLNQLFVMTKEGETSSPTDTKNVEPAMISPTKKPEGHPLPAHCQAAEPVPASREKKAT